jgi:hypothetical protein
MAVQFRTAHSIAAGDTVHGMNMNESEVTWPSRDRSTTRGYTYVIKYSTGAIKVGYTRSPRERYRKLWNDAAQFGVWITDRWLSPLHGECEDNEIALIRAGCRTGKRLGAETFDCPFEDMVAYARMLPMSDREVPTSRGLSPSEQRIAERRSRARTMRANGSTMREIAAALGISLGAVHSYCAK